MLNGITEPSQQAYRNFQRRVDRLCLLIVASDCSDREIDIRAASPACSGSDPVPGKDATLRHGLREPFPSASAAVP